MPTTPENTTKLLNFVAQKFEDGELDNNSLVQLIELAGGYLNLMTIPDYSTANKITYNGVKYNREVRIIFNVKFVIDND